MIDFRFDWTSKFILNIEIMDQHHKEFFRIARDIEQLIQNQCINVTEAQMLDIIVHLREYTSYHYYAEEQLMIESAYENIETHKAHHAEITKQISNINIPQLKSDPVKGLNILLDILREIAFYHILVDDKILADFLIDYNKK